MQELASENIKLKEINVNFQLENYTLQKKLRQLESLQNTRLDNIIVTDDEEEEESDDEYIEVTSESKTERDYIEISEEYLEEYEENYENDDAVKRSIEEAVEITAPPPVKKVKIDSSAEMEGNQKSVSIDEIDYSDAKEAMTTIIEMAARRGLLNKIKSVGSGKQKDSAFVSKILDVVFDKITLATSSAQGQRYQTNPSRAPNPALDANFLDLCRRAFYYRIKQEEGLDAKAFEARFGFFLTLVNNKVQNSRKCFNRHDNTKSFES